MPEEYLMHHGVLKQKWGVRRYQNEDGSLTPLGREHYGVGKEKKKTQEKVYGAKVRTHNLDQWGKDRDHNLLIVTGPSGSGKSTLARKYAENQNAKAIHMDAYWDNPIELAHVRNPEFDKYLKRKVPEYDEIVKNFEHYDEVRFTEPGVADKDRKHYWQVMDKVRDAMYDFAKDSWPNSQVVAEGIQWTDSTLFADNEEAKPRMAGMPMVTVTTSPLLSTIRRGIRDDTITKVKTMINVYGMNKVLNEQVKEREKWVMEQLEG